MELSLVIVVIEITLLKIFNIHFMLQILQAADKTSTTYEHPLALLAEETKKLLRKDSTVFMPVLSKRHPQATIVSASLLHRLFGIKLVSAFGCVSYLLSPYSVASLYETYQGLINFLFQKPFLDGAEHLTEDVVSVFPAADSLEQYIISLIASVCEEETAAIYCKKLTPYQVRQFNLVG